MALRGDSPTGALCRSHGHPARPETATHPDTARSTGASVSRDAGAPPRRRRDERTATVPDEVRQEIDRLKALYHGFHYRELARIVFCKVAYPIDDKTVKLLWQQSPVPTAAGVVDLPYPSRPLSGPAPGGQTLLSRLGQAQYQPLFAGVPPTVDAWIARFEAEHSRGSWTKNAVPRSRRAKSGCPHGPGLSSPEGPSRCGGVSDLEPAGAA